MEGVNAPSLADCFHGHHGPVRALDFRHDMTQLVSGSTDGFLLVWHTKKKARPLRFMGHKGPVNDVSFSHDGNTIASASSDHSVRLWTNNRHGHSTTIHAHCGGVRSVDFSADSRLLVSGGDDKSVKVWSVRLPEKTHSLVHSLEGHSGWVRGARLSRDSRVAVSASEDKTVRIWDVQFGVPLMEMSDHLGPVATADFVAEGTCVVSGSDDKTMRVFELRSREIIQKYIAHKAPVTHVAPVPFAPLVLSSSLDGTVKMWDLRMGRQLYALQGHSGPVMACAFGPTGELFASGGEDHAVLLWNSNLDAATAGGGSNRQPLLCKPLSGRLSQQVLGGTPPPVSAVPVAVFSPPPRSAAPTPSPALNRPPAMSPGHLNPPLSLSPPLVRSRLSPGMQFPRPSAYTPTRSKSPMGAAITISGEDHQSKPKPPSPLSERPPWRMKRPEDSLIARSPSPSPSAAAANPRSRSRSPTPHKHSHSHRLRPLHAPHPRKIVLHANDTKPVSAKPKQSIRPVPTVLGRRLFGHPGISGVPHTRGAMTLSEGHLVKELEQKGGIQRLHPTPPRTRGGQSASPERERAVGALRSPGGGFRVLPEDSSLVIVSPRPSPRPLSLGGAAGRGRGAVSSSGAAAGGGGGGGGFRGLLQPPGTSSVSPGRQPQTAKPPLLLSSAAAAGGGEEVPKFPSLSASVSANERSLYVPNLAETLSVPMEQIVSRLDSFTVSLQRLQARVATQSEALKTLAAQVQQVQATQLLRHAQTEVRDPKPPSTVQQAFASFTAAPTVTVPLMSPAAPHLESSLGGNGGPPAGGVSERAQQRAPTFTLLGDHHSLFSTQELRSPGPPLSSPPHPIHPPTPPPNPSNIPPQLATPEEDPKSPLGTQTDKKDSKRSSAGQLETMLHAGGRVDAAGKVDSAAALKPKSKAKPPSPKHSPYSFGRDPVGSQAQVPSLQSDSAVGAKGEGVAPASKGGGLRLQQKKSELASVYASLRQRVEALASSASASVADPRAEERKGKPRGGR
uniref:TEP-1 second beta-propeller domain-containing protein n=1 Tax=Chromera velia CCMP2878 TaxID=1169474 RepID=A0A0G4ID33_9ALVE|eukprot:Cvel_13230.t1-p1 / transcript=Cvel_13230.t1 / gene=Cvel_13230 / organism=Chromera_velia_CCMP2878 / gene_product=POC1 centriolar protein homolog A, putative / transcript_product=POC1 centriolar protein homolog A, putative / location=Cvel_scaffold896:12354-19807(+) / protein_length=1012 / sequence_SO=supercontig / SO=protein_coding / is_pseudo=false